MTGTARPAANGSGNAAWRPVAVQYAGVVGADGGDGAVGVPDDFPAPAVNHDQMVEGALQVQVLQAGRAALGAGDDVMDLAGFGGLVAARESAVLVAQGDCPAQVRRDGLRRGAHIQGQAR